MLSRIVAIFLIVVPSIAFGAIEEESEHAFINVSRSFVDDGEEVALQIVPKDGWYIHSANPGEFGMPAKVKWNNDNVEILKEQWSLGKDINYQGLPINVFQDKGVYSATIMVKDYDKKLALDVAFMACGDECFPEKKKIEFLIEDLEKTGSASAFGHGEENIFSKLHFRAVLFAFLGGLLLNIMPCVFPVLFIKIIGLINIKNRRQSAKDAILYLLGVVFCFAFMAMFLLFLKSRGQAIGWGFQLQSPLFLLTMIGVFFVLGLMFLDVININLSINKIPAGSFFTGLLAVLIASPCTAPFMGAAVGWSLTAQISNFSVLGVFVALGLGYALPFFVAGFFPNLIIKILPKPGKWMLWIKRAFAVPMFLTCLWLLWVLAGGFSIGANWQKYDDDKVQELVQQKEKIFIDFSAKWCITCLANEKAVLDRQKFFDLAKDKNIHLFKADWTNYEPNITKALEKFGRGSVPLYVFFDGKSFVVLPQIISFDTLLKVFD